MYYLRKSEERGATKFDWLNSKHTFSFGHYYDEKQMSFGSLRVINEDIVVPKGGFPTHPHHDMEIITYVLEGALEHKDSLGTGSIILPGDVQRMSAGTGISHSEFNPKYDKPVHLLQIWIIPEKTGLQPSYEQKNFAQKRKPNQLTLLASHDGRDDSLTIHQDANIYVLDLNAKQTFTYNLHKERMVWIQMARGSTISNEFNLKQGDGIGISDEKSIHFDAIENAEILIFDLTYQKI
jgi:quercetin 2,3-dioxygenase